PASARPRAVLLRPQRGADVRIESPDRCYARKAPGSPNGALFMKHARLAFVALGAPLLLALAACGGSSGSKTVPPDAVAVVSQIQITRDQFDKMLAENKAQMKAQ